MNEKIKLEDSIQDVFWKLSGDNPGALTVCMDIYTKGGQIDPDNFMGGLGALLALDTNGIYESKIWMLYKDVCKENLVHTVALLRAVQLGKMSRESLLNAIDNYGKGIDVQEVFNQVREELPNFAPELV